MDINQWDCCGIVGGRAITEEAADGGFCRMDADDDVAVFAFSDTGVNDIIARRTCKSISRSHSISVVENFLVNVRTDVARSQASTIRC